MKPYFYSAKYVKALGGNNGYYKYEDELGFAFFIPKEHLNGENAPKRIKIQIL